jgi:hypothetical protein
MQKLNLLLKNINLLNIILIASIILMASYIVFPLLNVKVKYTIATSKKVSTVKEEEPPQVQTPSPSDYTIIAEQNLFHPERKIPPEKKDEAPLPKPEFVLYGTLITDNVSFAYLEDKKSPRTTPGRGKRQTALKKGDTMSGFQLKEIDHDKVVMARGEETLIVKVIDSSIKKDREGVSTPSLSPPPAPASRAQAVPGAQKTPTPSQPTPRLDQAVKPTKPTYRPQ